MLNSVKILCMCYAVVRLLQDLGTITLSLICWTLVIIVRPQSTNFYSLFRIQNCWWDNCRGAHSRSVMVAVQGWVWPWFSHIQVHVIVTLSKSITKSLIQSVSVMYHMSFLVRHLQWAVTVKRTVCHQFKKTKCWSMSISVHWLFLDDV
jgi:hypothetical protein